MFKIRQLQRFISGAGLEELERHATWMEIASSAPDIQQSIDQSKHQDVVNLLRNINIPAGLDKLSKVFLKFLLAKSTISLNADPINIFEMN